MEKAPDYLKPYEEAVAAHGGSFEATLWRNKDGQYIRFKTFCNFIDFTDTSILDVGCGIGDFAQYLLQKNISFKSFHGIDAMGAMIDTASKRNLLHSTFETIDILKKPNISSNYDWITFSGTLNAMREEVARGLIDCSFEACIKGIAFNFLSDQSGRDPKNEDLTPARRFNTLAWINHALTLSTKVDFTQSYLDGHDATIVLKK